jgi:hypothetical protein
MSRLPRTRDFRGISVKSIDEMGNYNLGIREHTIFPETADEDIKDVFGLAVTVVTTSNDKEQPKLSSIISVSHSRKQILQILANQPTSVAPLPATKRKQSRKIICKKEIFFL